MGKNEYILGDDWEEVLQYLLITIVCAYYELRHLLPKID